MDGKSRGGALVGVEVVVSVDVVVDMVVGLVGEVVVSTVGPSCTVFLNGCELDPVCLPPPPPPQGSTK